MSERPAYATTIAEVEAGLPWDRLAKIDFITCLREACEQRYGLATWAILVRDAQVIRGWKANRKEEGAITT